MDLVRYIEVADLTGSPIRVGARSDDRVTPLAVASMADLLTREFASIQNLTDHPLGPAQPLAEVAVLPPIDGATEVWASGVTYVRSREARVEESAIADVYQLVYEAERPELFFKSVAWRVVTDGEQVAIRRDSPLNVPEAELAVVINAHGQIVGYTVCNDMSSRSIEGENPLYLPQAKIYAGSCALAAGIRPAWEIADAANLAIEVTVSRAGQAVWHDATNTARLHRSVQSLVDWLFLESDFPAGVVLSTGTGLVPEMDFTLRPRDVITIVIDQVGSLNNVVVAGKQAVAR